MPCVSCEKGELLLNEKAQKNYALDTTATQDSVCLPCLQLVEHDKKIKEKEAELRGLILDRSNYLRGVNEKHDPFINCLPLELASHVLCLCLSQEAKGEDVLDLYDPQEECHKKYPWGPVAWGMVSRRWRSIVQATPQLWTSVPVRLDCRNPTLETEILNGWLNRSGILPLSIGVWFHGTQNDTGFITALDWDRWRAILKPIHDQSSRWKSLRFLVPVQTISLVGGCGQRTSDAPILEELRVAAIPTGLYGLYNGSLGIPHAKLAPRRVHLVNIRCFEVGIEWSNVTEVVVKSFGVVECFKILDAASQLRDFEINLRIERENESDPDSGSESDSDSESGDLDSRKPVSYSTVEAMRCTGSWIPGKFFTLVTLPALRELDLVLESFAQDELIDMLTRSDARILRLSLRHFQTTTQLIRNQIATLFEAMPMVAELIIYSLCFDDDISFDVLEKLAQNTAESKNWLPDLQRLSLNWHTPRHGDIKWSILPEIFHASKHTPSSLGAGDSGLERPLRYLSVTVIPFDYFLWTDEIPRLDETDKLEIIYDENSRVHRIDRSTARRFANLRDDGFEIKILDSERHDLLQMSLQDTEPAPRALAGPSTGMLEVLNWGR